jgi:predicted DNA-binding protein YlxM (UPF0122 family)
MKHKLTRDWIINEAFAYVSENGLDKLSMRNLADKLNVKAMSLYNHIEDKEDVVERITDQLIGLLHYDITGDWQSSIMNRARALKDLLLKHSWGILPLMYGFHTGPFITRDFDQSIGILRQKGFSYRACDQIISSINYYVYGYVLSTINFPIDESQNQHVAEDYKDFYPMTTFPHLFGMSEEIRLGLYNGVKDFDLGVEFIIKGIEAIVKEKGEL